MLRPLEILLSLGSYFIITLSRIAECMKATIPDLELTIEGRRNKETHAMDRIVVSVKIQADHEDQRKLETGQTCQKVLHSRREERPP